MTVTWLAPFGVLREGNCHLTIIAIGGLLWLKSSRILNPFCLVIEKLPPYYGEAGLRSYNSASRLFDSHPSSDLALPPASRPEECSSPCRMIKSKGPSSPMGRVEAPCLADCSGGNVHVDIEWATCPHGLLRSKT